MKRFDFCLLLLCLGLFATTLGCGGAEPVAVPEENMAQAKVDAFKKLADAMAKEPNGMDARIALEEYRNCVIDFNKNRKEGEEIVEIHRLKIKGKYQGAVSQDVQLEITPIETILKRSK